MKHDLWVLDCSAAAAFLLNEDDGAAIDPLIENAINEEIELVVPCLFAFELLNVLLMAERRARITRHQANRLCAEIDRFPVSVEPPLGSVERQRIHQLGKAHALTAYDAAYLELAERQGARLKTFDPDLLRLKNDYPWIE